MDPVLAGLIGVIGAALVGQIVQIRKMSGQVGTSEAQTLWSASEKLYDAQARKLENLEKRIEELESDKHLLQTRNLELTDRNLTLEREAAWRQERCEATERENEHLRQLLEIQIGGDGAEQ